METIALCKVYKNYKIDKILWILGKGNLVNVFIKILVKVNNVLRDLVLLNEIII